MFYTCIRAGQPYTWKLIFYNLIFGCQLTSAQIFSMNCWIKLKYFWCTLGTPTTTLPSQKAPALDRFRWGETVFWAFSIFHMNILQSVRDKKEGYYYVPSAFVSASVPSRCVCIVEVFAQGTTFVRKATFQTSSPSVSFKASGSDRSPQEAI